MFFARSFFWENKNLPHIQPGNTVVGGVRGLENERRCCSPNVGYGMILGHEEVSAKPSPPAAVVAAAAAEGGANHRRHIFLSQSVRTFFGV